jgi:hypothetical protein
MCALAAVAGLTVAACSLDVNKSVNAQEAGLPDYPGAQLIRKGDGPEAARVNINTAWFGVNVVAAKYRTDDEPAAVLAFYRQAMAGQGALTECRGDVDFEGHGPDKNAVCTPDRHSDEVKLVAGARHDQRIVSIKPHGHGAEFAVVHVSTR